MAARSAVLAGVLLAALALLGRVVAAGPLSIDLTVTAAVAPVMPPLAVSAFDLLAGLPIVIAIGACAASACLSAGRRGMAAAFVLGVLGEIPTTIAKAVVDRARPPAAVVDAFGSAASYPSGHTVRAVVLAGLIVASFAWSRGHRGTRAAAVAVAMATVVLVGLARIASGQHWPTDVVGGLLLGGAWLTVCLAVGTSLDRRLAGRRPTAARETRPGAG